MIDTETLCEHCQHKLGIHGKGICFGTHNGQRCKEWCNDTTKLTTQRKKEYKPTKGPPQHFGGVKINHDGTRTLSDGSTLF